MFRKITTIAAALAVPAAGFAGAATLGSGVATAGGTAPAAITCALGGSLTFAAPGLSSAGNVSATAKTSTTNVTVTSSSTGCDPSVTFAVTQADTKCAATTLTPVSLGGTTLPPPSAGLAACAALAGTKAASKDYQYGSAWGFADGSSTSGIVTALKKGVSVTDHGTAYTLIPSAVSQILPGGVCGPYAAGFAATGSVKKFTSTTFTMNLCLGTDTTTGALNTEGQTLVGVEYPAVHTDGTSTDNFFLDLAVEVADAGFTLPDTFDITGANLAGSSLTIS